MKDTMGRLMARFRGWPTAVQVPVALLVGLVLVGVATAPFTSHSTKNASAVHTTATTEFVENTSEPTVPPTTTTLPVGGIVGRVTPLPDATTTVVAGTAPTSPPPTAAPRTYTPPPTQPVVTQPPAQNGTCTASMSNSAPGDGGEDTVNVTSDVPNSPVTATAHYKTTTTPHSGTTDGAGSASITFGIGRPTVGYRVVVDVDINGRAHCQTSFTPQ